MRNRAAQVKGPWTPKSSQTSRPPTSAERFESATELGVGLNFLRIAGGGQADLPVWLAPARKHLGTLAKFLFNLPLIDTDREDKC